MKAKKYNCFGYLNNDIIKIIAHIKDSFEVSSNLKVS
jgi:hypothetical protein